MLSKRFLLLGTVLVALNLFLWLVPGGLALPQAVIDRFFGPRMVRAEVILRGAGGSVNDFRLDRGVITATAPDSITLREQDGTDVTVPVDTTARVVSPFPRFRTVAQLRPRLRVLVVRKANSPAELIQVEAKR